MPTRKFLTRHEVAALLRVVPLGNHPERNQCLILMAFIHGLRASELLSLRLADIDMRGRILHVSRMKNGFSTVHPLTPREIRILKDWLRVRQKIIVCGQHDDKGWLFITRSGSCLSRQQFYNIVSQAGRLAGLSITAHPHMLRHACGYALADNGVDTRLIQDYLGHRNIRHTVRYTASSSARFDGIWQPIVRRKRQQSDPNCKPI
ncbi:tyrosine-type recombinase/integrase [Salmonella enterica]|uniref:Tyrosine-type recombinase/integrase n=1 Tax=Salmonella enterica TaxID=28901 RepID=A0A5U7LUN4_SALER|nr:pilus assembly protein [Salmonella enterica]EBP3305636.1 tyrosine-type recombinase/integrase [Salmonella enterica subsp. enterica]ELE3222560.1 tyrosine-type recombinase/integrase [Salmonella enterica subsp. enterica serovar Rubislaw]EAX8478880.1 pilus assembly protein [Salmonella enterica]EBR4142595.1 tyrosine-type recombinase/integrase [Salmonella enterica]